MGSRVGTFRKNDYNSEEVMNIKKTAALVFIMGVTVVGTVDAQPPETFDQAKALSAQQDKPMLLEFFRAG